MPVRQPRARSLRPVIGRPGRDQSFEPPIRFSTGVGPVDLCLGDFNEDGRTDIATANGRGNSISVLLGAAVGFGASVDLPAVAAPSAVTATDFNGDGNDDLVAANEAAGTLSVWLGHGDGTFGGRIDLPGGGSPKDVAAADLDGDGKPDLVTANSASNTITVHTGDGSGGVAASVDLAAGPDPREVLIADMNGDGKPDLIVASQGASKVEIHLNRGGTFAPRGDLATGLDPSALAYDDYNRDGDLDLAVCDPSADCVAVLEGDGAGGIRRRTDYPVGSRPGKVLCGDLAATGESILPRRIAATTRSRCSQTDASGAAIGTSPLLWRIRSKALRRPSSRGTYRAVTSTETVREIWS